VPDELPPAFTRAFAANAAKEKQWSAFARKSRLEADSLDAVIELLKALLWPPTRAVAAGSEFNMRWTPIARSWR
jgi:hypothetical protein